MTVNRPTVTPPPRVKVRLEETVERESLVTLSAQGNENPSSQPQ